MRYILDSDGYIEEVSFGAKIICNDKNCTEYTGTIPDGYDSLCEWSDNANIRAYKIVEDNLVYDAARDSELQVIFEQEEIDNSPVLHKDMYEVEQQVQDIQSVNNSQYLKSKASGKIITVDNVKACFPNIKLTNIDCYSFDKIDFLVTGKNMLPNTATTQTIDGVTFIQNEDRSITISGTATADIEYNIAGTSKNTSPFLCFKKNVAHYLSSNGHQIKMYYFDGTDRTEVYNGLGGSITFTDADKPITQVVLSIPKGTTIINKTIHPMLNLGTTPLKYETYKSKELRFSFSKLIEDGLFPSDDLYPSDDLFPQGTTIDYITIENGYINVMCNEVLEILNNGYLGLFDGYNIVYTIQDTNIEMEYCIDILDVESLEFLQGKATTTNKFKILEDGSIEAHNGFFSGTVNAEDGYFNGTINAEDGFFGGTINAKDGLIGGYSIGEYKLYAEHIGTYTYTTADITKIQKYLTNQTELTDEELKLYDVDEDGEVTLFDLGTINKAILNGNPTLSGKVELNSKNMFSMFLVKDGNGNEVVKIGVNGINTNYLSSSGNINCDGSIYTIEGMHSESDISVGMNEENGDPLINLGSNNGVIKCVSLSQSSLAENKKNFELFGDALPIVKDIDIYKYNLKFENDGDKKHLGFVIGKDYKYSSEITTVDTTGKEIGVDNYSMTSLCLQAIKELNTKIEQLEMKIKELEEK